MRAFVIPVLASILILGTFGLSQEASAQVVLTNTGHDASAKTFDGNILSFIEFEGSEGVDLNGDGDIVDPVFGVFDVSTGITTNPGLALEFFSTVFDSNEKIFALAVSESIQGNTDLNGDGDTIDRVWHVFDASTGSITNTGLVFSSEFLVEGNLLVFVVNEFSQGSDLNGDGDLFDRLLHTFDASTGIITNTGLAGFFLSSDENLVAFLVSEFSQGTDLNGDGDTLDNVLHILDVTTGTITNLGIDRISDRFVMDGNLIAFSQRENLGVITDLNGDGDTIDIVLHILDVTTGTITNLGIATGVNGPAAFLIDGNLVVASVNEFRQGNTDLNGDGDTDDFVVHVFDTNTGITTNLGLISFVSRNDLVAPIDGNLIALLVCEFRQGSDLNGDGDTVDCVWHVYDSSTGITTNIGLASTAQRLNDGTLSGFFLAGDLIVFNVFEPSQANTDFNGDGDASDRVLHIFDASTGSITNLGISSIGLTASDGNLFEFLVGESSQGGVDLNGDGDTGDAVVHLLEVNTQTITNLGINAASNDSLLVNGDLAVFSIRESGHGGSDVNGDGDSRDRALHIFDPTNTIDTNADLQVGPGESLTLSDFTINGNIQVDGGIVTMSNCTVNGDIISINGGTLSILGCTVTGTIASTDGSRVVIVNSNIDGDVKLTNVVSVIIDASTDINLDLNIKGSQSVRITDSNFNGNVKSSGVDSLTTIENIINGNVKSSGDGIVSITDNTINGNLQIKKFTFCLERDNTVIGNVKNEGCIDPPPPPPGGF